MTRAFVPLSRFAWALLLFAGLAVGHPMGNLSINHYARIEPGAKRVNVTYVLDLAEIPTFELTQNWNTPAGTRKDVLDRKAAGKLPVFRITSKLHIAGTAGRLEYEDRNFATRAGWREVVVRAGDGAEIR